MNSELGSTAREFRDPFVGMYQVTVTAIGGRIETYLRVFIEYREGGGYRLLDRDGEEVRDLPPSEFKCFSWRKVR